MIFFLIGLVIGFTGDVNMGRTLGKKLLADSTLYPFMHLDSIMHTVDLNVINLEGIISEQNGITQIGWQRFTAPPISVKTLKKGNVKVVSVANNHAIDFGGESLMECFKILKDNGIEWIGGGETYEDAFIPVFIKKGDVSVGIVGVTSVSNYMFRREDSVMLARADTSMIKKILNIMDTVDYRVIFYHGDYEYSLTPSKNKVNFARWCIENGFDLFIGHHPHVPQSIEIYRGKFIFYSLGNFVFKQKRRHTDQGIYLKVYFKKDRIIPYIIPVKADFFPSLYPDESLFIKTLRDISGGIKFIKTER